VKVVKILGVIAASMIFLVVVLQAKIDLVFPEGLEVIIGRTNIPNAVTAVYLETRLYDTIFEVIVFSITALGVTTLFSSLSRSDEGSQQVFGSVTVYSGGLAALSITLFLYLVLEGHISPGGGFVGGVVLATGIVTYGLTSNFAKANSHYDRFKIKMLENASLIIIFSLVSFIILFPEMHARLLAGGEFGEVLSGGLIPVLNILIGIKVYAGAWKMSSEFINRRGTL
jgi:multicomponent Na+:H+ antiporter subunit B